MVPGQEGVEVAVRPAGGNALERVGQPGLWIDAVETGGGEQGGDAGPGPAAAVGAGEEAVLSGDGLGPDGAFDGVAVDVDAAVVEEALERRAARQGVADRFGELGLAQAARDFDGCSVSDPHLLPEQVHQRPVGEKGRQLNGAKGAPDQEREAAQYLLGQKCQRYVE